MTEKCPANTELLLKHRGEEAKFSCRHIPQMKDFTATLCLKQELSNNRKVFDHTN